MVCPLMGFKCHDKWLVFIICFSKLILKYVNCWTVLFCYIGPKYVAFKLDWWALTTKTKRSMGLGVYVGKNEHFPAFYSISMGT